MYIVCIQDTELMEVNTNEDASATHPVVYAKPVITITVFCIGK